MGASSTAQVQGVTWPCKEARFILGQEGLALKKPSRPGGERPLALQSAELHLEGCWVEPQRLWGHLRREAAVTGPPAARRQVGGWARGVAALQAFSAHLLSSHDYLHTAGDLQISKGTLWAVGNAQRGKGWRWFPGTNSQLQDK